MASLLTRLRLSPLPEVAAFLVQRAQQNHELQDALDDGLENYTQGAEVIMKALAVLLDEWLEEGALVLHNTDQFTDPHAWLAISDHLEVVQQFRELLPSPVA